LKNQVERIVIGNASPIRAANVFKVGGEAERVEE
jgi:hypothetical protein